MKLNSSPPVTAEMAAHIKFLMATYPIAQHQAAALCGVNQGRVSEIMRGKKHLAVRAAKGPFPVPTQH
ncbi:MAG: hypothetical protein J7530_07980 [Novosphingobium sp.]|nr:hypothetical protein [Novosphingobium sp.]